jgi:hypothetical protein
MSNETKNNDSAHPYTYTGHNPNEVTEPDYKTLYTELLQGVKDAKAEMNNQFRKKLYADTIILGMAYNNCIEILTDKTNVL